jgi:endogenous inhibitor of DNA gyrase (YacG/DUF329 family)
MVMEKIQRICPICGVVVSNLGKHKLRKRCDKQKNVDHKKLKMRLRKSKNI